jgi:hypothetical protein
MHMRARTWSRVTVRPALAAAMVLMLVSSTVASATYVGDQLNVIWMSSPATWPADTAFHVKHGFCSPDKTGEISTRGTRVEIWLDGRKLRTETDRAEYCTYWYRNFPSGLSAGTHTWRVRWTDRGEVTWDLTRDVEFVASP